MASLPQCVAIVARQVAVGVLAARLWLRPNRRRLLVSLLAVLTGAAILTPWSWWWHGIRLTAKPGWWWLPILLLAAGLAGLAHSAARWWGRGGERRRQNATRVPLFVHVAALLLMGVTVAVAVGVGMWVIFGRPHLAVPSAAGWSVQNTFDGIKIVLAVVAGIGGVVALTVAYRRQGHSEAAEHREDTKLFNDRFGKAAEELGSDKAAVRLAGVYAMAGLADDWTGGRQTCIDVLCAYVRMPYTPPPDDASQAVDGRDARQEQQVRHTVLALIRDHLLRPGTDERPRWHGHRFNFSGAVIDGGNLSAIDVPAGTTLDLTAATFPCGTVDFTGAAFSHSTVSFINARFSGSKVDFGGAEFSGCRADFGGAEFSRGTVDITRARFSEAALDFTGATFSGSTVDLTGVWFSEAVVIFTEAEVSGGTVVFDGARFSGGELSLSRASLAEGMINFARAGFSETAVDFTHARFSGSTVNFINAEFLGRKVDFTGVEFTGGAVDFTYARFSGSRVGFGGVTISGSTINFINAEFSDGTVGFSGARFSAGTVNFTAARFFGCTMDLSAPMDWTMPPVGVDGSEQGVRWPSAERLIMIAQRPA